MNWRRSPWICRLILGLNTGVLLAAGVGLGGCGVKGDPLPPERPPRMGRGRPTYRKAAEKIKLEPGAETGSKEDPDDEQRN